MQSVGHTNNGGRLQKSNRIMQAVSRSYKQWWQPSEIIQNNAGSQ